jgi:hypothetical protein
MDGTTPQVAADALVGQVVSAVRYVGLDYPGQDDDVAWDFGAWHWPEVAVEIETASGRVFSAIWDSLPQFMLTFAEQPVRDFWLPLREAGGGRCWDVSGHARWRPFIGHQVTGCDLVVGHPESTLGPAPVAVRIQSSTGTAWIAAIAPGEADPTTGALAPATAVVGADEVIVLFDETLAGHVGLGR